MKKEKRKKTENQMKKNDHPGPPPPHRQIRAAPAPRAGQRPVDLEQQGVLVRTPARAGAGTGAGAGAGAAAGGDVPAAAEEKTEFDHVLEEFPADKKIPVLKIVREITGLGLKEAKELVEGAPKALKEGAAKAECEEAQKKLEELGAKGTLK